jgi:hypothetical protein
MQPTGDGMIPMDFPMMIHKVLSTKESWDSDVTVFMHYAQTDRAQCLPFSLLVERP